MLVRLFGGMRTLRDNRERLLAVTHKVKQRRARSLLLFNAVYRLFANDADRADKVM